MVKYDWQGRDRHKVQEENMVQRISIKGLFVQEENMVQRISIKGLFGYFDYEIHCGKKEFQF